MNFYSEDLSNETLWRSIILFGRNVASYKFALGKALLELAEKEKTKITLEELAPAYSRALCEHIKKNPKQGTFKSSKFLKVCNDFNQGLISNNDLIETTVKLGFNNVIDAFHIVNSGEIPIRFFHDERSNGSGISISDELLNLTSTVQFDSFSHEIEARWRLVETAWDLKLPARLLSVSYDKEERSIIFENSNRRIEISSCRDALNGYQKGYCFYSRTPISLDRLSVNLCDVDHFLPHTLCQFCEFDSVNINGIWNLVLSSRECNRGEGGKFAKLPKIWFLEKLHERNEYFISSHHPLRETIINQTGQTELERRKFLQSTYNMALKRLVHQWEPTFDKEDDLS
jgi:hypothetical protein